MSDDAHTNPDTDWDPEGDMPRMTLPEHLDELRARLLRSVAAIVVAMIGSFIYWKELLKFVTRPYYEAAARVGLDGAQLTTIDPGEGFLQILKLCFLTGFVIVSPVVLWQMWGFIAAGLYDNERRIVRIFFPVSIGLIALGVVAAYVLLIPFGLRFLIGWNVEAELPSDFRLSSYLSTCLTMVFGMGLIFLLPLVMLFLQATGVVARETFAKGWRYAVMLSFVAGMILTDPSPVTQIAMAIPVTGLYFMGVWGGRFVGEDAEKFTIRKAWPIVLFFAAFGAMLFFSEELNDLAAQVMGPTSDPGAESVPEPGAEPAPDAGAEPSSDGK